MGLSFTYGIRHKRTVTLNRPYGSSYALVFIFRPRENAVYDNFPTHTRIQVSDIPHRITFRWLWKRVEHLKSIRIFHFYPYVRKRLVARIAIVDDIVETLLLILRAWFASGSAIAVGGR